jgi:DNA-binding YbaB/EbfC family protein
MVRLGGGLGDIMKQAQKMQQEMMRVQEQLGTKTVEASSGGGMVTVVMNGRLELVSIKIEKDVVDPNDIDMLQDLVRAAVNEGLSKAQDMVKDEMAKVTGGLSIPGLNV